MAAAAAAPLLPASISGDSEDGILLPTLLPPTSTTAAATSPEHFHHHHVVADPLLPASISGDSEDDLLLPNLLPPTATTAAATSPEHFHHHHVAGLSSPVTVRALPSQGLSFQIWPSASTLLRLLTSPAPHPHLLPASPSPLRLLELGSGTGLAGIALAAALPAHSTLSDLPSALPNLRFNAALNGPLVASRGGSLAVAALPWGDPAAMEALQSPCFDAVVASDVVYYEELVEPLMETLRFFVKGEVVFLMAHLRRWKRTDKRFFGRARKVFDVMVVHEDPPLEGWRHGPVVYRFMAKGGKK